MRDVHPWSYSTEFRGIRRDSSDCNDCCSRKNFLPLSFLKEQSIVVWKAQFPHCLISLECVYISLSATEATPITRQQFICCDLVLQRLYPLLYAKKAVSLEIFTSFEFMASYLHSTDPQHTFSDRYQSTNEILC